MNDPLPAAATLDPPDDVVEHAGSPTSWVDVEPTRPAAANPSDRTWLSDTAAVKAVAFERAAQLDAEAANSAWLGEHVATASPLVRSDGQDLAWLVTARIDGVPAHRPDLHGDVGSLAEVAGQALRKLHALPLDVAPDEIDRGWDALEAAAEAYVAGGGGEVDEPYQRYTSEQLLELWRQGRPAVEDLVICHGDPALPNMLARQGAFVGWVDLGGVRIADRHLDLAHAHASIHRNLGPEAVYVFYDTYGQDPDLLRLDHYLLAKQLLP